MSILPKLLFCFRSLPLYVSCQTIELIQKEVNAFVWQAKKPRLNKKLLCRPTTLGGLGLPHLLLYYASARLVQVAQWHSPPARVPWLQFERSSVVPYYLPGLLWLDRVRSKDLTPLNGVAGQSLQLWSLYKTSYVLVPHSPCFASFLGDPRFPAAYNIPNNFS